MEQNITKNVEVKIVTKTWTPEGGQPTNYKRLVLEFVLNGNRQKMEVKLDPNQMLVLESLPETENILAGDEIRPTQNIGN